MKKLILVLVGLSLFAGAKGQDTPFVDEGSNEVVSVGILHGGGALLGADFEMGISKRTGLQVGLGYVGFGAGLNYHFEEDNIASSCLSLQYWNQGIGDSFTQNVISGNYIFRGKKWFTATIGMGIPLSEGPALPANYTQPPVILTYAIGAYFRLDK